MAIVMQMSWPEVSREQYEQIRKDANWEGNVPRGAKLHVAYFAKDGFRVVDLWESAEDFNAFAESRLMASVQKVGIKTQPSVEISPAHAVFAPNP